MFSVCDTVSISDIRITVGRVNPSSPEHISNGTIHLPCILEGYVSNTSTDLILSFSSVSLIPTTTPSFTTSHVGCITRFSLTCKKWNVYSMARGKTYQSALS